MPPAYTGSKACSICHQKKIKCDLIEGNQPCTNCNLGGYSCRPHQRKRKRYALSPSPSREHNSPKRPEHDVNTTIDVSNMPENGAPEASGDLGGRSFQHSVARPSSSQSSRPFAKDRQGKDSEVPFTSKNSYVGHDEYLGGQVTLAETEDAGNGQREPPSRENEIQDIDLHSLKLRKALDLPSRAIRESLVDAFMERCHSWMPIVERRWLDDIDGQRRPSLLLLQAVFLAGSRVTSSPLMYTSSSEFYERARALFFHGHEKNTTLAIVAVCLLQWWNPTGPEKFSTNTSGFWVRIGTELAYQVGLHKEPAEGQFRSFRRRLWWTLVSRDSIISVGTGRPRTINIEDSNITPPTVADFATPNFQAHLFVAYVSICRQMGDIAEAQRRKSLGHQSVKQQLENSLFRWVTELAPALRIVQKQYSDEGLVKSWTLAPYSFEARQLVVPYFVSLILLYRSPSSSSEVPTVSLMASSYVVSIFEEFLSRDQLRFLGPVFAFYALAAGLVHIVGFRYESLQAIASHEFNVIQVALEELGKRWGSAQGALRALNRAKKAMQRQPLLPDPPPPLSSSDQSFFTDFGPELCSIWNVGFTGRCSPPANGSLSGVPNQMHPGSMDGNVLQNLPFNSSQRCEDDVFGPSFAMGNTSDAHTFDLGDMTTFNDPLANPDAEGSWLFHDFDLQSMLSSAFHANS